MNTAAHDSITNRDIRWLDSTTLDALQIGPADVVRCIEQTIRDHANGKAWATPKSSVRTSDGRYFMSTLAATDSPGVLAVKSLVMNPKNVSRGIPQINSLVTLLDNDTGVPLAILDGNWVTAVRTAGLSATAAQYLARKDASTVAFVGCGVQARSHLDALAPGFALTEAKLLGRGSTNIDLLAQRANELGINPTVCSSAEEALTDADIVVTSISYTSATPRFINAAMLKPGCFAAIADLGMPWISESMGAFSRIIIDDMNQESAMATKLAPGELVQGDIGQLVLGQTPGRADPEERNAFLFRGHALGDVALAALVWERVAAQ